MRKLVAIPMMLFVASACDAPKRTAAGIPEPVAGDTAFAAMNARHAEAVNDDPMSLEHQFISQPDGGDIVLERSIHEDLGINQIRAHLLLISRSFSNGDFSIPGFVHDKPVPGTDVMADRSDKITYTVEDTDHGGIVHIRTKDPEALKAIHAFIDFQIAEHHTQQ